MRALADGAGVSHGLRHRLLEAARQIAARLDVAPAFQPLERLGWLIAQAYPDRVAQRRAGQAPRYRLAGGRGAVMDEADRLARSAWLAVAHVGDGERDARIRLAAELHADDVAALEAEAGEETRVEFDVNTRAVIARRVRRAGSFVLEEHPLAVPAERALPVLLGGLREQGLALLPWTADQENFRRRVELLRSLDPQTFPAFDDKALLETLEAWLAPFITGVTRFAGISPALLQQALDYRLGHGRLAELDRQAPEFFILPTGQRARIDYTGETPVLAARIQQFFGLTQTPAIADGRMPLTLHLLSPANRPMQVTRDLASFWTNTYPEVRKDLRGRYPKHAWPEDPLAPEVVGKRPR